MDALDPSTVKGPDVVTVPDADKGSPAKTLSHLRMDIFYRMGFDDREIVALSGAHALGRRRIRSESTVNQLLMTS